MSGTPTTGSAPPQERIPQIDHDSTPPSCKARLAFALNDEGPVVSRALGLGPEDTEQFLSCGLTLRPEHHAARPAADAYRRLMNRRLTV